MSERVREATPEYEVAYSDLVTLMRRYADKVSAFELLAIAANLVGKLIAMQDQRTVTRDIAMKTVLRNIEVGNQQVVDALTRSSAGRA